MLNQRNSCSSAGWSRRLFNALKDDLSMEILFAGVDNSVCRSEEHTSELQSRGHLVCRLLLEKKKSTAEFNELEEDIFASLEDVTKDNLSSTSSSLFLSIICFTMAVVSLIKLDFFNA